MSDASFAEIAQALRSNEKFLVLSHVRPDGDALGCQLAMGLCLEHMGKQVKVWNEDGVLEKFQWLPKSGLITKPPAESEDFDVVVALDTAVQNRVGNTMKAIRSANLWINIDHHVSNNHYGDLAFIDPLAPATGQILYELIRDQDLPLTYAMADNLFVAISTDTGSFQYPNTSARTFEVAAELIRAGVNVGEISARIYESYPRRRIELLRALLNTLKITCDGRVASFALSMRMAQEVGAKPEDNEGLIDHIRAIDGVKVAVFLEEIPDGVVRLSMRSKDADVADVCEICQTFGGGGHKLAAGARTRGELTAVEAQVLKTICDAIRRNT